MMLILNLEVSKLFRAYGLYNKYWHTARYIRFKFQSSFELTGYITMKNLICIVSLFMFQSSFELTGYITLINVVLPVPAAPVSKLFRAYGLYNKILITL